MDVQAKFRVTQKTEHSGLGGVASVEVTLQAVYDADPTSPNHSWSKYTPSGEVKMSITNPAAAEQLKTGKAYLLTFTEVEG